MSFDRSEKLAALQGVHIRTRASAIGLDKTPAMNDSKDQSHDTHIAPQVGLHEWFGHSRDGYPWRIHRGDALAILKEKESASVQCIVTSPPYYSQRDYDVEGQIGLESSIDKYVTAILSVTSELKRILKKDGVLFLNLGDTYYSAKGMPRGDDKKNRGRRFGLRAVDASGLGVPRKTAIGIPWRVALSMIEQGWTLRSPIVWQRTNALPEATAHDRPWRTYEFVFMFVKSPKYQFFRSALNGDEDIWKIDTRANPSRGLHLAAFPLELAEKCIVCATRVGDVVLDPFSGTGTTMEAALRLKRNAEGIDIKQEYCEFIARRLGKM